MAIIHTLGEILHHLDHQTMFVGDQELLRKRASAISIDSRDELAEALFVALRGDRFDAHEFVSSVQSKKALAAIVRNDWLQRQKKPTGNFIGVDDPLEAMQSLAKYTRRRWGKDLVAITGSSGKSTTKEMLASILSQEKNILKNSGNLNNHIGLPLTLVGLKHSHDMAVVEMGANHFGEIAHLCDIAAPNFGLITNIGRAHIEYFGDLAGVAKAKSEMFHYLAENDGIAFINADDHNLAQVLPSGLRAVTFGIQRPAQVSVAITNVDKYGYVSFDWRGTNIRLNIPGMHHISNALGAIAVASYFGVEADSIKSGIENCEHLSRRMEITDKAGLTVINDAYNSSPESLLAALQYLEKLVAPEGARKIAVLGDMLELGESSEAVHQEIGQAINDMDIQAVFGYGPAMKHLVSAIEHRIWAVHFDNKEDLVSELSKSLRRGDTILVKGSRAMAMEEVVDQVTYSDEP